MERSLELVCAPRWSLQYIGRACAMLVLAFPVAAQVAIPPGSQGAELGGARKTAVCAGIDKLKCAAESEPVEKCKKEFEDALEKAQHAKDNGRIRHNPAMRGGAAVTGADTRDPGSGDRNWDVSWGNTIVFGTSLGEDGSFLGAGANSSANLLAGVLAHEADHVEDVFSSGGNGFAKTWGDSCARAKAEVDGACLEIKVLHAIKDKGGLTAEECEEIDDRTERLQKFKDFHKAILGLLTAMGLC